MAELITHVWDTHIDTDPNQIVRLLWDDSVHGIQSFYHPVRGWQIVGVGSRRNTDLADKYDTEFYNIQFDCDEANGLVHIVVK
jgi:hypothetical protein